LRADRHRVAVAADGDADAEPVFLAGLDAFRNTCCVQVVPFRTKT